jgi:lipopolysaccharide export system protein LptC
LGAVVLTLIVIIILLIIYFMHKKHLKAKQSRKKNKSPTQTSQTVTTTQYPLSPHFNQIQNEKLISSKDIKLKTLLGSGGWV